MAATGACSLPAASLPPLRGFNGSLGAGLLSTPCTSIMISLPSCVRASGRRCCAASSPACHHGLHLGPFGEGWVLLGSRLLAVSPDDVTEAVRVLGRIGAHLPGKHLHHSGQYHLAPTLHLAPEQAPCQPAQHGPPGLGRPSLPACAEPSGRRCPARLLHVPLEAPVQLQQVCGLLPGAAVGLCVVVDVLGGHPLVQVAVKRVQLIEGLRAQLLRVPQAASLVVAPAPAGGLPRWPACSPGAGAVPARGRVARALVGVAQDGVDLLQALELLRGRLRQPLSASAGTRWSPVRTRLAPRRPGSCPGAAAAPGGGRLS